MALGPAEHDDLVRQRNRAATDALAKKLLPLTVDQVLDELAVKADEEFGKFCELFMHAADFVAVDELVPWAGHYLDGKRKVKCEEYLLADELPIKADPEMQDSKPHPVHQYRTYTVEVRKASPLHKRLRYKYHWELENGVLVKCRHRVRGGGGYALIPLKNDDDKMPHMLRQRDAKFGARRVPAEPESWMFASGNDNPEFTWNSPDRRGYLPFNTRVCSF